MTFRNLTEPGPVSGTMQCQTCGTWHMGAHYCPGLPRYGDGRHYGSLTEDDVRRIVQEELDKRLADRVTDGLQNDAQQRER